MDRPYICIAGKNNIAVDVLKYIVNHYGMDDICVVCNRTETGENGFQRSFRKYAKMIGIPERKLDEVYGIQNLVFLSLEFDRIVKPQLFSNARLYNIHFSLLPKYKGMYTSAHPILNGDKYSGVTLHYIDAGIDTGDIIDQERFEIGDCDCRGLYQKYIEYGTTVVLKNIDDIIWDKTLAKKQNGEESTYYSKCSISYANICIDLNQTAEGVQRQIRAYSFREYQLPEVFGRKIGASRILETRAVGKPGTILFQTDEYIILNTVDYHIVLIFDEFDELMTACANGDLESAKRICANNARVVNEKDDHGWTPLIVATYNNQVEIVQFLIAIGADSYTVNRNGTNLLMYAKEAYKNSGDNTLFKLFANMGLSVRKRDYMERDLLSYIAEENITLEELMN